MATLGQYGKQLKDMSRQEVIQAATKHLLEQGGKSVDENYACIYNGVKGRCCGAAPFIEDYNEEMEGRTWCELQDMGLSANSYADHDDLIAEIQDIHDCEEVEDWKEALSALR